jgi:flagellar protein FliO/FliZ
VEVLPLDPRRRLVLIRHDDNEHLLLLGADGNRVIEGGLSGERRAPGGPP